ncbi:MAG: hypothetical protein A0129_15575 [Limnobacter sp. CACIAM 66H1]|uniref:hypothetical protein n=1 Tax=Limnobacter sp. CACIAM 66H1 TaxID=1813033 RepID=UPI0007A8345D|nr:hypothetical protein [Limnobacter sp. CACIAM 66H1]KYP09973.1 MAG: hypothetical protein A0129_15575 [Limnobacter sp. CACIAM 66H1]
MTTNYMTPNVGHEVKIESEGNLIQFRFNTVMMNAPKRGAYRKLHEGAYKSKLLNALSDAAKRVSLGEKPKKGIIRFNENTQAYELHFGIGRRCTRFENSCIPADRVPEFGSPHEVLVMLRELIELTQGGAFDQALDDKLHQRQAHSQKMIRGKAVDSFVSLAQESR